jgi:hypothetical protein
VAEKSKAFWWEIGIINTDWMWDAGRWRCAYLPYKSRFVSKVIII